MVHLYLRAQPATDRLISRVFAKSKTVAAGSRRPPRKVIRMRIAIIGQSQFAASVFKELLELGHEICGVFTIEDKAGREDALAVLGHQHKVPVFKVNFMSGQVSKGQTSPARALLVLWSTFGRASIDLLKKLLNPSRSHLPTYGPHNYLFIYLY